MTGAFPDNLASDTLLDELLRLVSQAGSAVMRARGERPATRTKSDGSPVTQADERSEAILLDGLARLLPGVPVVSEEQAARAAPMQPGACFVLVDPLDGTREFIAGRDEFTINLAIVDQRRPLLGLLAAPARGRLWCGRSGRGAQTLSLPAGADPDRAEAVPIRTRGWRIPPVVLVSRSHPDPQTTTFIGSWPQTETLACGSALKFALIAEGKADLYPRLSPTCEWDIAAGDAILTAAGGRVSDRDGQSLLYGRPDQGFLVPSFLAWGDDSGFRNR